MYTVYCRAQQMKSAVKCIFLDKVCAQVIFAQSANECRQSIPLPLCDLSQSTEAHTTPYSRSAAEGAFSKTKSPQTRQ